MNLKKRRKKKLSFYLMESLLNQMESVPSLARSRGINIFFD